MNKGELISSIARKGGVTKAEAARTLHTVIESIREGVDSHGRVSIAGFGAFRKKNRKARQSVNPATGAIIEIKAFTTVGFTPSLALRNGVC